MAQAPLTERLLRPPADAGYEVRSGQIPISLPHPAPTPPGQASGLPFTWFTPRGWRSGAATLVVCGAGDNRHAFKLVLFRALLCEGIAALTIDPPGHGELITTPCTRRNLQAACSAAVDWMMGALGAQSVGVLGISLGGCQVLDLARRDSRPRAVVSISTPIALQPITRALIAREALQLMLPRNLALLRRYALTALWAEWRSMKGAWFGESLYDLVRDFDALGASRAIGARPTLFVHGSRDVVVPPCHAQQLYDAALPEKDLLWVQQGTHVSVVLFEREMQQAARWLREKLS